MVLWLATAAASDGLFVGNSYTASRDLDRLTREALRALGDDGATGRLTADGLRWVDHVARAETPGTPWEEALVRAPSPVDWGVLQEQSQILGFDADTAERRDSLQAAITLDGWLADQGAQTVLLLTWGRRDGDATLPALYPDFLRMQDRLNGGTVATRDALSTAERPVWIAPAGLAWRALHLDDPEAFAALYQPDGSHPSIAGAWLTACVIAVSWTGRDPAPLDPPDGLDPALAEALRDACRAVVLDGRDDGLGLSYPWSAPPAADSADPAGPEADPPAEPPPPTGCGCATGAGPGGLAALPLAGLAVRRRSRGSSLRDGGSPA